MKRTAAGYHNSEKENRSDLLFIPRLIGRPVYWLLVVAFGGLVFIDWLLIHSVSSAIKAGAKFIIATFDGLRRKLFRPRPQRLEKIIWKAPKVRLPKLPKVKFRLRLRKSVVLTVIVIFIFLTSYCLFRVSYRVSPLARLFPNPSELSQRHVPASTKIYDRNGILLYKIFRSQNRTPITLSQIPLVLKNATLAVEDAEFYQHHGFSPKAIIRAFFQNLKGEKLYGGSTITQQLVKNTLLGRERTLWRKIKEIITAIGVEARFSKDEILEMYFNEVGYGGTAYGSQEASQTYFGKNVGDLSLAEAALLAGLPASPSTHSPYGSHPEKAKERQRLVLKRMVEEKFITPEQATKAEKEELHFLPPRNEIKAPHFVMYIKELLAEKYGLRTVEEGGLQVTTSLDWEIQKEAERVVTEELKKIRSLRVGNAAVLVTKPATGEILAMVGSKNYFDIASDGNVNVTLSLRQPGSSIKPINYAVALENGFTAATILSDTPITYQVAGQPPYSPKNYDRRFHGNVPLRIALASSYNIPAVKVLSAFGVDRMINQAKKMGINSWEDPSRYGLSLTLGGGEVRMTEMAVAYSVLANLGNKIDLQPILEVKDAKGKILEKNSEFSIQPSALDPGVAFILTSILADPIARSPAFGLHSWLNIANHPNVAVKTGTTQNLRDNWTIGYTPDFLTAVWVGNNDNTPMSYVASGVTGASPIWSRTMSFLLKDIPDKEFSKPENIVRADICPLTGTLSCEGCGGKTEYFLANTEPKNHCSPERIKEMLLPTPISSQSPQ